MAGKQVRDEFLEELFALADEAVGEKHDERHRNWAKRVDLVDPTGTNGYAFQGDFVKEGTVEVELKPTAFLVATARGSRKYHTTTYHVVIMDAEGNLELTGITTDSATGGWALRLRDKVIDLLAEMAEGVKGVEQSPLADRIRSVLQGISDTPGAGYALGQYGIAGIEGLGDVLDEIDETMAEAARVLRAALEVMD